MRHRESKTVQPADNQADNQALGLVSVPRETSPFRTMADVRAANQAIGHCFFSRETMRLWKSRVETKLLRGRYFVTSEQVWSIANPQTTLRWYALRYVNDDGSIKTLASCLPTIESAKRKIG